MFYGGPPKEIETDCIGKDCDTLCNDYQTIDASITKVDFYFGRSDIGSFKFLLDIDFRQADSSLFMCGQQNNPDLVGLLASKDMDEPLIGFEYIYGETENFGFTRIMPITNTCAIHQHAVYELDLG